MIGLLTGSEVKEIKTMDTLARIVAVNFYDDKYLVTYTADSLSVYKGESLNLVMQREIEADLNSLKIESGDGFVVARNGDTINSLDMEAMHLDVWDLNKDDVNLDGFGWLDRGIIYSVLNGKLFVHDFDGQNERELSSDVDGSKPVIITDNKWLYYFSNGALMREWLIKKQFLLASHPIPDSFKEGWFIGWKFGRGFGGYSRFDFGWRIFVIANWIDLLGGNE